MRGEGPTGDEGDDGLRCLLRAQLIVVATTTPRHHRALSHDGRRKWAPFFGLERQAAAARPASQSSDCSFCALSPRLLATEGRPPIWPRRPEQQRARKLGQSKAALIRTSLLARPVSSRHAKATLCKTERRGRARLACSPRLSRSVR